MNELLPRKTNIGAVALIVPDLSRAVDFYLNIIGLRLIDQADGSRTLGGGDRALVRLIEKPGSRRYPNSPGLYHFAILLPDRFSLARLLYQLVERNYPLQGASDHGVSEALYLTDPLGNGIELYRDRPEEEWPRENDGTLGMVTRPLNLDRLLFELKGRLERWEGIAPQTRIGHIHLQVRDIPDTVAFYTKIIGLELQQMYGSQAAFLSAGGYHHHVGVNTWHSLGAEPAPVDSAGLSYYELSIPTKDALDALIGRIEAAGLRMEEINGDRLVKDPSGNGIRIKLSETTQA